MSRVIIAGAALSLVALLAVATPSVATSNKGAAIPPKTGIIEVVVEQIPGGRSWTIGRVSSTGAFRGEAKLPAGNYSIHTVCSQGVICPSNQLTSLQVDGRSIPLVAGNGGGGTRDFVNQGLITNSNNKLVKAFGMVKINR